MSYIDGFVAAVPTANRDAYLAHAAEAAVVFKDHGALRVVEAWGDDVPEGKLNSFHTAVLRKPDEAVIFSWIVWPDRATREAGWAAVMADPRMAQDRSPMPFDGARMIYGGFETILDA
jgi:uncharacterized protein YbaA (DUF1428 family)